MLSDAFIHPRGVGGSGAAGPSLPGRQDAFPFKRPSDLLKCGANLAFGKLNDCQSVNIGKRIATLFQQDNRPSKTKPALKQACFVYHIFTRPPGTVRLLVLPCHHEQGKARLVKHRLDALGREKAGGWFAVVVVPFEIQAVDDEVLQLSPSLRPAMPDEDSRPSVRLRCRLALYLVNLGVYPCRRGDLRRPHRAGSIREAQGVLCERGNLYYRGLKS